MRRALDAIDDTLDRTLAPLSRSLAPMADGLLRRFLLRAGVVERQVNIGGLSLHYYHRPATAPQRPPLRRVSLDVRRLLLRQALAPHPTPLLLVHGLGDSALTWALTMALMAPGRDIYAVDLPGYGLSGLAPGQRYATMEEMRVLLETFVRHIVARPALVAGNSMGGWIAVRLAEGAPDMVREVVLINAGGAYLDGRPSWEPFRTIVAMPDLKTTRLAMRQVVGPLPAALLYITQYSIQELFQRQVVRAFVELADERDFITAAQLRALSRPASLIWGTADHFLPAGSLEFFRENLPGAPTMLLRCGHLPQRERPLPVARFLDSRGQLLDAP